MTGRMQRLAGRLWSGELGARGVVLAAVLWPASLAWRVVTAARNRRHDRRVPERVEGLGVISVGNLAVGGTGKTPVSAWVVDVLLGAGGRPAILSRGYGRDELLLHQRWHPGVPVVAEADRVQAARHARALGCDVAVLDDGFQHRRLGRDVDVVLLAVEDGLPGPLLPRGPFREPPEALGRADAVVLTRRGASLERARALQAELERRGGLAPEAVVAGLRLAPKGLKRISDAPRGSADPGSAPAGRSALVVTAVARPRAVLDDVESVLGSRAELFDFADHHDFTVDDMERVRRRASGRPIVVTEKDAVKLEALGTPLDDVFVLGQTVSWDWGEEALRALVVAMAEPRIDTGRATRPGGGSP